MIKNLKFGGKAGQLVFFYRMEIWAENDKLEK